MIEAGNTYAGGCLCGAVRYRLQGPSLFESQCCCKDCQRATGTGHTTIIGLHQSQLTVEGTPRRFTTHGESGGAVHRHFCGECGGRIYTSGTLPGEMIMVQAGSLDDPNVVQPASVEYHKDAVSWDMFDPKLPIYEMYAPLSDATAAAINGISPVSGPDSPA